jgi:Xaa-Pro aminopeptidase
LEKNIYRQRIRRLREKMKEEGISIYVLNNSDFHLSEEPSAYFRTIEYISGFTGSEAKMVVTDNNAHLWTDGRYAVQVKRELEGTGIIPHIYSDTGDRIHNLRLFFEAGGEAVMDSTDNTNMDDLDLEPDYILGFDGRTFPFPVVYDMLDGLGPAFDSGEVGFTPTLDLVGMIWDDRPPLPDGSVTLFSPGTEWMTTKAKMALVRSAIINTYGLRVGTVITALDDIAWLYNIRGTDSYYSNTVMAYSYINDSRAWLFIDENKLNGRVKEHLKKSGVTIKPYDSFYSFLEKLEDDAALVDMDSENSAVIMTMQDNDHVEMIPDIDYVARFKSVKDGPEISGMHEAALRDAAAMISFIRWVKENVGKVEMTETGAADYLAMLRKQAGSTGPSFETICAYGPHAAVVHYTADQETNAEIRPEGFLLVDSGGQYRTGTTDITRTIPLGGLTDEMKRDYTIALDAMLELGAATFRVGVTDKQIDMIPRKVMWDYGEDFDHSTGHGIGCTLDVHERPINISWRKGGEPTELIPGMIMSDEPGIYREGKYGIRHENEIICQPVLDENGEFDEESGMLMFLYMTFVPIDTSAVDRRYMSQKQISLLNDYNQFVYEMMEDVLADDETREWLRKETLPI